MANAEDIKWRCSNCASVEIEQNAKKNMNTGSVEETDGYSCPECFTDADPCLYADGDECIEHADEDQAARGPACALTFKTKESTRG